MAAHGVDEPTAASPAAAPSWPPAPRRKPSDGDGGDRGREGNGNAEPGSARNAGSGIGGGAPGGVLSGRSIPSLPDLPPLRAQTASGLPARREPAGRVGRGGPGAPGGPQVPAGPTASGDRFVPPGPAPSGDRWGPPGVPTPDPYATRPPGRVFVPGPGEAGVAPAGPAPTAPAADPWGPPAGPAPSGDQWPAPASGDRFAPAGAPSGDRHPVAGGPSGERRPRPARKPKPQPTGGLKPVYDIEGPKVRLGVAWFLVAVLAVAASPFTAALCYGVAAGWASRQVVQAWRSTPWQADLAAGLGALPVVAALAGAVPAAIGLVVAIAAGAGVAFFHPEGERMPGKGGRLAAAAILGLAVIPSIAAASVVLTRATDVTSAVVLVLLVSAYEAADFIVGSGASNVLEGPLAGATTAVLFGIPLTLVLIPPFDGAGMALLGFLAVCPVVGQVMGASLLPRAGAAAPAVRRLDSLLVLGLVWVAATAAF